jgi:hypothetical protein
MNENQIENKLIREVAKLGGLTIKFTSPSVRGLPDRIVLLPGGRMTFIELKAPGKVCRPLQLYRAHQFEKLGFRVECLDTYQAINIFIEGVKHEN